MEFVPYDSPAKLADDAAFDKWDVAMIGADPARAAHPGLFVSANRVSQNSALGPLTLSMAVHRLNSEVVSSQKLKVQRFLMLS